MSPADVHGCVGWLHLTIKVAWIPKWQLYFLMTKTGETQKDLKMLDIWALSGWLWLDSITLAKFEAHSVLANDYILCMQKS